MRRRRLRWYVFGAQAAVAYGRPRMTGDVDVTVDLKQEGPHMLLDELSSAGFALRIDLSEDFLRESRLLPLVHTPTAMPVDLVIAGSSLHAEFLARRRFVDIGGLRVPMLSPEDLVVTKILAGRPKDIEDVRGVLLEQPRLNIESVRELLGDLAIALGDPSLLRRFERIVRKTRE
jgi:predicted nucleotidyltransferase